MNFKTLSSDVSSCKNINKQENSNRIQPYLSIKFGMDKNEKNGHKKLNGKKKKHWLCRQQKRTLKLESDWHLFMSLCTCKSLICIVYKSFFLLLCKIMMNNFHYLLGWMLKTFEENCFSWETMYFSAYTPTFWSHLITSVQSVCINCEYIQSSMN